MSMLGGCRAVTVFVESVSEPDEHPATTSATVARIATERMGTRRLSRWTPFPRFRETYQDNRLSEFTLSHEMPVFDTLRQRVSPGTRVGEQRTAGRQTEGAAAPAHPRRRTSLAILETGQP